MSEKGVLMKVYQLSTKLYLMKTLKRDDVREALEKFVVTTLSRNEDMLKMHTEKGYKPFCYGWLEPIERDGIYKEGNIYSFKLRTINENLEKYLKKELPNTSTQNFKGLVTLSKEIPEGFIEKLYSLTPVVIKIGDSGYWQNKYSYEDFERQIKTNLFKKYKDFINTELDESQPIFNYIELTNKIPWSIRYKEKHLLGDKINIGIASNSTAQKLAYLALGTGIGTMNGESCGFVGYKY